MSPEKQRTFFGWRQGDMIEEKGRAIPSMRRISCAIASSEMQLPTGKDQRKTSKN